MVEQHMPKFFIMRRTTHARDGVSLRMEDVQWEELAPMALAEQWPLTRESPKWIAIAGAETGGLSTGPTTAELLTKLHTWRMEGILTEDISYRIWQSCSHHGEETVCISTGSVDGTGDNWVTATGTLVGDATSDDLRNVLANIGMVTQPMVQCKTELTDGDPRRRFQVRLPSKQACAILSPLRAITARLAAREANPMANGPRSADFVASQNRTKRVDRPPEQSQGGEGALRSIFYTSRLRSSFIRSLPGVIARRTKRKPQIKPDACDTAH